MLLAVILREIFSEFLNIYDYLKKWSIFREISLSLSFPFVG